MSLVNNSANNFKDFLDAIKPYLNYQFYDMSGQGVEANNFSTDEKVIGTWIDGKPLYQKTVDCGTLPDKTTKEVLHNIANVDKIVSVDGFCDNGSTFMPLPYVHDQNVGNQVGIICNTTKVILLSRGANMSGYNGCVILRYTKTTDTAVASGEKIVGQWIDGKPLYEKVFNVGSGSSITYPLPSGIEKYVECFGIVDGFGCIPRISSDAAWSIFLMASEGNIDIRKGNGVAPYATGDAYVTLRYTKTTD